MDNKLYSVPAYIFYQYVEKRGLTAREGVWVHSTDYVDGNGQVLATMSSSSWSMHRSYRIADEGYVNLETTDFISQKF